MRQMTGEQRARFEDAQARFFAAPLPKTPEECLAYDQLQADLIAAMGYTEDEFAVMTDRFARTGCTRESYEADIAAEIEAQQIDP